MARLRLVVDNGAVPPAAAPGTPIARRPVPPPPRPAGDLRAPQRPAMRVAAPADRRRMRHAEIAVTFTGLVLFMGAIRIAAHFALTQPLVSDSRAYFAMAQAMATGAPPTDSFGQHAFHAVGYPLLLAPAFALFGATPAVAFAVNLALAVGAAMLVAAIARALGYGRMGEQLAVLGYAVWLPGVWHGTMVARENLTVPLLLAVVLAGLRLAARPRWRTAVVAGLAWGAAVLTDPAALALIAAPLIGLALGTRGRPRRLPALLLALAGAAALLLTPWFVATGAMVGRPVLTTSAGFDLYLGNNPAATGSFVSIARTPMGPRWHPLLAARGEAGAGDALGVAARGWIAAHPGAALRLTGGKLLLFWAPNPPRAADFGGSGRAVALVRLGEVAEYLAIVALGLSALVGGPARPRARAVIAAAVAGLWLLHAAGYVVPQSRDPLMPLLILLAAGVVAAGLQRRRDRAAARILA